MRYGWLGVRPIARLWVTCVAVPLRRGFTSITRLILTMAPARTTVPVLVTGSDLPVWVSWGGAIMVAALSYSLVIPSTILSIIHISRQVSPILTRRLLSPMAGLYPFSTWCRRTANQEF